MKKLSETLQKFYNYIPIGQENAINSKKLCFIMQISDRRKRTLLNELIMLEHPILNFRNGYFRPKNKEEIATYRKINNSYKNVFMLRDYYLNKAYRNFKEDER